MSLFLGILGGVLLWVAYRLYCEIRDPVVRSRQPDPEVQRERDLLALRDRFASTEMAIEDYEASVQRILQEKTPDLERPPLCVRSLSDWEVHIHNAQPGHHLHLHLDG